jgi:P-type Mg2+ transporter
MMVPAGLRPRPFGGPVITRSEPAPSENATTPAAVGLTTTAALERLRSEGPNTIEEHGRRSLAVILLNQVASPLVILLIAASVVAIVVGDRVDAGIILVIVVLSAALGFVQEARSEGAVAALRARLALRATVIRDGTEQDIPARELVRGDVVVLNAGDIVPADGRLFAANHLYVDESALTGESAPTLKAVREGSTDSGKDSDRDAFVFFGTSVVSGLGHVELTATGERTTYGLIARRLIERPPRNDFERGVRRFGLLVSRVILLLVVGVFAADVALHRPLVESLLFAIALAVGLTPELLPAIVTINLSRGARALAQRGVLVKRLPAIQNLGSMTILCTDKTGTLTEGRLTFERAVQADGAEAPGAVVLAWLNSHFQTGFTNPLDMALLATGAGPGDLSGYRKLGELPFDFQRRCLGILVAKPDGNPLLITKGAPEAILERSTMVRSKAGLVPLDDEHRAGIAELISAAASEGDRAIAVATRTDLPPNDLEPGSETALAFEGLLLFSDPPKADIGTTLADLRTLGVALKVVTGDSEVVARAVARQVGLSVDGVLTGDEIRTLSHTAFAARAGRTTIFARVDPDQKLRVIRALQERDAVVGYLGDGINDAPPLHHADVGISVDNGTDVARAAADIVLLQPSLAAIAQGVREGRRTFANTLKYIRMGISSNFGNMLSMAGAALFLPFLPMLPSQILLNNLIYDGSQTAIPSDDIDPEMEAEPARWDIGGIERFMLVFGPISSIFDYATFGFLLLVLHASESEFHTGWFVESLATQVLVIFAIRTRRSPFWRSRPSRPLLAAALAAVTVAILLPISPLATLLGFTALPPLFWLALTTFVVAYLAIVEIVKRWIYRSAIHNPAKIADAPEEFAPE